MRTAWLSLAAACALSCARVEPWQRGALADWRMQADPSTGRAAARRHVLAVREGSEGAARAAGAACGCN